MHTVPTHLTAAQFCKELQAGTVRVNHDYQRSNKIWPATAQSFLIESMLLGFPVPKLTLYQITDRVTRDTVRELVDGQQRTEAIVQFYNDRLRLSRTLEFTDVAGRTYSQLDDELQDRFLSYSLAFDLFVDATPADIRELFRHTIIMALYQVSLMSRQYLHNALLRANSLGQQSICRSSDCSMRPRLWWGRVNAYETPLNGEEQRYARFQGPFKWFIYRVSRAHDDTFKAIGTFTERQLARMADMKLLTEVSHALLNGITTTNKASLDALYRAYDDDFEEVDQYLSWLDQALAYVRQLDEIKGTGLTRPYCMYSLLLAVIHALHDVPTLRPLGLGGTGLRAKEEALRDLGRLADILELERRDVSRSDLPFWEASEKGTNVQARRATRFEFLFAAVASRNDRR